MNSNWKQTIVGEFSPFIYGKSLPQRSRKSDGTIPVFGSNGPVGTHNQPLVNEPGVIIGRKGSVGAIHFSKSPFWPIDTTFYITEGKDRDIRFAYYLLKTLGLEKMNSDSAVPGLNREAAHGRIIYAPPLPEQRAIADVLSALDGKIELNRRMNQTLEQLTQTLFKNMFIDNPESEGWGAGKLGDDFNLTMGQSPPGNTYNEESQGLSFYQGRTDFGFRFPTNRVFCTAPTRFAHAGDTLISVRAPVGDMNMAIEECSLGRGVAAVIHKTGSQSYTYYAMRNIRESFTQFEAEGTVFGSINKNDFLSIKLIIPPENNVMEFEKICHPLDQLIENNEKQSQTLAELRDTLLPKLMSGQVRVRSL
jgi:type I restriction enzyme S subunit